MSTTTAIQRGEPGATESPAPGDPVRWMLVRMVAAAFVAAGAWLVLSIGGNLALGLDPTGGPMGAGGSVDSVGLAGTFFTMSRLRAWEIAQFQASYGGFGLWMFRHAQTSRAFFGLLAGVQVGLAGVCGGIGYGLRRRRPWARTAAGVLIAGSALFAAAHGAVLLASGFGFGPRGLEILATAAVVAGPILALLGSRRTAALFGPSTAPEARSARKRRWWTLSAQWLGAVVVVAIAFGLVRLLAVGPMVEVAWAGSSLP